MISADAIRGYIDLMVLSLLRQGPSYAYEIAQSIAAISGDDYTIKQTTLYSAVKRLESTGLVTSYADVSPTGKPRTYYRITDAGLTQFAAKATEWNNTKIVVDRFIGDVTATSTGQTEIRGIS